MLSDFAVSRFRIIPTKSLLLQIMPHDQADYFYSTYKQQFKGSYIYIFIVHKNNLKWKISKRLVDFIELAERVKKKLGVDFTDFGIQGDVSEQDLFEKLEKYLLICLKQGNNLTSVMLEFLQQAGNMQGLEKYKQISVLKKAGGRYQESCLKCGLIFSRWKKRYFTIYNEGIIYKDESNNIKQYLSYDYDFKMVYNKQNKSNSNLKITLMSSHRKLQLKALSLFEWIEFIYYVKIGFRSCEYVSVNRFGSFAPLREKCNIKYLVDGEEYFSQVAVRLNNAQKQVFITDWWLSPQFYLIRPITQATKQFRLDRILERLARKGVKIHIIVYHESTFLLNDSLYTKTYLQSIHSNIKVLRHPTTILPTLWSHHEKLIVIDQTIGFISGLDLCYGRWDTAQHQLFDINKNIYPGIQYNNIRAQDIINVRDFQSEQYQRQKARLPWHDIGCMIEGNIVWDLSRHFIQYWNYASFEKQGNDRELLMRKPYKKQGLLFKKFNQGIEKLKMLKNKIKQHFMNDKKEQKPVDRMQVYVERTMNQSMIQRMNSLMNYNQENRMRTESPLKIERVSKSMIIQNRNRQKSSILDDRQRINNNNMSIDNRFIYLLNQIKEPGQQQELDHQSQGQKSQQQQNNQKIYSDQIEHKQKPIAFKQLSHYVQGTSQCQIVWSVGPWSIGCSKQSTQCSVQVAYIQLIANSKHYIYIQNQFFISSCANSYLIKNQIGNAIVLRILKAIQNNEKFKVYIVLPLLPGFAGQVDDPQAKILKLQMYWQYQTISRSKTSIFSQLAETIKNPEEYIKFFGLRTHSRLSPQHEPITEIIYVHSKLMIVDDEYVILGSANINDRSMRGKRDSQVCVVSRDAEMSETLMNGQKILVSKNTSQLRKKLFRQHFGLRKEQQLDPLLDHNWFLLRQIALQNTMIYKQIFACYPDDEIKRLADTRSFMRGRNHDKYEELKDRIRGNVVEYPLEFLYDQNLNLRITEKEYLIPTKFAT